MSKSTIKPSLRWAVFARDGFVCQYCGASPPDVVLHCDHVRAESEGGETVEANLVTACEQCNLGKGAKLVLIRASDLERREIAASAIEHFPATADAMIDAMSAEGQRLADAGVSIEAAGLCLALAGIRVAAEVCYLAPLPRRIGKKRFLAMCAAQFDETER